MAKSPVNLIFIASSLRLLPDVPIIHKEENSISGSPFGNIYGLKAIKWEP